MTGNKPKLLIVEDDEWILKIFSKVFEKNFEINLAPTIQAFYSSIENKIFDGFIVDLSLRGEKNGVQLIEELRQMDKYFKTPIVVVTANALRKDRESCLKAGATKFITKPVDNNVLLQEVLELYPGLGGK